MEKVKHPTLLQQRQQAAERCMRHVMRLLEWSELKYCYFKYEQGLLFLDAYLKGDTFSIDQIVRTAIFWGWWKNQWTMREQDYVQRVDELEGMHDDYRLLAYLAQHDAVALANGKSPEAEGLSESYANMIGLLMADKQQAI